MPRRESGFHHAVRVKYAVLAMMCACGGSPLRTEPLAPGAPTCPAQGCGRSPASTKWSAPLTACPGGADAACGGASAAECTERALASWSEARDDHAVACIARMLSDSCTLGYARACSFAGRLMLEGRGVPKNADHGLTLLTAACDDGFALACLIGIRWLEQADHAREMTGDSTDIHARLDAQYSCLSGQAGECFRVAYGFYTGQQELPARDHVRAIERLRAVAISTTRHRATT